MRRLASGSLLAGLIVVQALAGTAWAQHEEGGKAPSFSTTDLAQIPGKVRRVLFQAQQRREAGESGEAVALLRTYLSKHPEEDHPLLRFYLASDLTLIGKQREALAQLQAAVDMDPTFAHAWLSLGEVAYDLCQYGLAGKAFANGYEYSPARHPGVLYYAAVSFLQAQEFDRALQLLTDLVSGNHGEPELDWYRALVSTCLDLNRTEQASRVADDMLRVHGDNPTAWKIVYQFAAAQGDYRRAAVALTVVGYLRPLRREELSQLGDLYVLIDVPVQACRYYEQARPDSSSPRDYERLSSAYIAAHDAERALHTLERALERKPTTRLWSLLADLYYMQEDYEESYRAFRECARLDTTRARAHLMMGYCALELGWVEEATQHLERSAAFPELEEVSRELLNRAKAARR